MLDSHIVDNEMILQQEDSEDQNIRAPNQSMDEPAPAKNPRAKHSSTINEREI